ncbi:MAG: hypothetical protein Alpg2KO_29970 [Alphaproteobacteria bacterium]
MFNTTGFALPSWWNGQYSDSEISDALDQLVELGVNAASIVPTWYTDDLTSTDIFAAAETEQPEHVRHVIAQAIEKGLQVHYKPHLDPDSGGWRAFYDPQDADAWFTSYQSWMLDHAHLAEAAGATSLTIGTEFISLSGPEHTQHWRDLIAEIRDVYSGSLTYAATPTEAAQIEFWDDLDLIGVNPYVQLAPDGQSDAEQLADAWDHTPIDPWHYAQQDGQSAYQILQGLADQWGMSILMTELGYRAVDGAATSPGDWELQGDTDPQEQADLYEAFFRFWGSQQPDWLEGVLFWHWDVTDQPEQRGDYSETGYSPQNRPAAEVISRWLEGSTQIARTGTASSDDMRGDESNDTLSGGAGDDSLRGGAGDDVLLGGVEQTPGEMGFWLSFRAAVAEGPITLGVGVDDTTAQHQIEVLATRYQDRRAEQITVYVEADQGAQTLWISSSAGGLSLRDIMVNGARISTQDYGQFTPAGQGQSGGQGAWQDDMPQAGTASLDLTAMGEHPAKAQTDNDRLLGQDGDDRLYGGIGDDQLYGGNGDDVLLAGQGHQLLHGGAGLDQAGFANVQHGIEVRLTDASSGAADWQGGRAELVDIEQVRGGAQDDNMRGSREGDHLAGAAGDDVISGQGGADILLGDKGADRISGNAGADQIDGGAGDDHLSGGTGRDQMGGGAGDDHLKGNRGNDRLSGEDGKDKLHGDAGADTLSGGKQNDRLYGGKGADTLSGDRGNDRLFGQSGEDRLTGGRGNDHLSGGRGDDRLTGGDGADRFILSRGDGFDRITDFEGDRGDRIDLTAFDLEDWSELQSAFSFSRRAGTEISLEDGAGLQLDYILPDQLQQDWFLI